NVRYCTVLFDRCILGLNDCGSPPFSYQNRSPTLLRLDCSATIHAKVGPTSASGNGSSCAPPINKSMSSTCLYSLANIAAEPCSIIWSRSLKDRNPERPHTFRKLLYPGNP